MTDLEMTKLCSEAMGIDVFQVPLDSTWWIKLDHQHKSDSLPYQPLHDDAQAMALVKKYKLYVDWCTFSDGSNPLWQVIGDIDVCHDDLNRAIVECVAKMQQAKNGR